MPFMEEENIRPVYCSVANGKLVVRVKNPVEGSVERTTKEGKVVHELLYPGYSGIYLNDCKIKSAEFNGKKTEKASFQFRFTDMKTLGSIYITMPYSSGYAKRFINVLANIEDFSKPLKIKPYSLTDEKTQKLRVGIVVYIGETKIGPRFKYDEIPQMEKIVYKNEEHWDDTKQMLFFENVLFGNVLPRIKNMNSIANSAANALGLHEEPELLEEDLAAPVALELSEDGLPF